MSEMREKWDIRWQEKAKDSDWQPDSWLQRVLPYLPYGGAALDLACGRGRNAIGLAEKGFRVTALDISPVALELLKGEAEQRGLQIDRLQSDLEGDVNLPAGPFDLVIQFYFLHRPLLSRLQDAVRPGGYAIIRTFSQAGTEQFGAVNKGLSFEPGELLRAFTDWEVLLYEEGLEPSRKGGSLVGIFARKKAE